MILSLDSAEDKDAISLLKSAVARSVLFLVSVAYSLMAAVFCLLKLKIRIVSVAQ